MSQKIQFRAARKPSEDSGEPRRAAHVVVGQVGGGSPYGATTYKRARLCPFEDGLVRVGRLRPTRNKEQLDVGWITHACREAYYVSIKAHQDRLGLTPPPERDTLAYEHYFWGGLPGAERAALEVADLFKDEPGYLHTWETVSRTISGYMDTWRRMDRWRILAIEETLIYEEALKDPLEIQIRSSRQIDGLGRVQNVNYAKFEHFGYSCRLDLVLHEYDPARRGVWCDEFKTARWISEDLLDGYQLDMQVLGQVWLTKKCVEVEHYGPFRGVIVDIVSRQQNPKCERVYVMPSHQHLAAFETSVHQWALNQKFNELLEYPRALGSCASALRGYSRCQFYDLCHGQPEMSVADWASAADAPAGFYREERMLEDPKEYVDPNEFEDYA